MFVHAIDPVLLRISFLEIRYYGLVYVLGFLFGIWWLHYLNRKGQLAIESETIWDLSFYLLVGVIVGSRLGMIVWQPETYLFHPLELFKIWKGGMSFHGGFVGIVVACWLYCKKKQLNFWSIADAFSAPALFALALGRIANFINGELVGRVWNGSWCVVFPNVDQQCRHPNMIYSALQRMLVAGWLFWLTLRKTWAPGFVFWNFVFWEGIGRILMDFFREDVLYGGFSKGQWLSLIMVLVAGYFLWKKHRQDINNLLGRTPAAG